MSAGAPMVPVPGLAEVKDLVAGCDRCGTCLMVCPLFKVQDLERVSARGKNAIARALAEGGLEPRPELRGAVDFCLLCRACADACPIWGTAWPTASWRWPRRTSPCSRTRTWW